MSESPTYSFLIRVINGNNVFYPRITLSQDLNGDGYLSYRMAKHVFSVIGNPFIRDAYPCSHDMDENKWCAELVMIENGIEYVLKKKKLSTKQFFNGL